MSSGVDRHVPPIKVLEEFISVIGRTRHVLIKLMVGFLLLPVGLKAADLPVFKMHGYVWCPEAHAKHLEFIIDSGSQAEVVTKLRQAVFDGVCGSGASVFEVIDVRMRWSKKGRGVACFTQLDPVDRTATGRYCSPDGAVSTIAANVARRTGAYKVVGEGVAGLKAECLEGGFVMIQKGTKAWERTPLIYPLMLEPPHRVVPPDREAALLNGCRGVDYLNPR